eukprot:scaffold298_cov247-Pinguiococcus_pyrenoidosus.AAC.34
MRPESSCPITLSSSTSLCETSDSSASPDSAWRMDMTSPSTGAGALGGGGGGMSGGWGKARQPGRRWRRGLGDGRKCSSPGSKCLASTLASGEGFLVCASSSRSPICGERIPDRSDALPSSSSPWAPAIGESGSDGRSLSSSGVALDGERDCERFSRLEEAWRNHQLKAKPQRSLGVSLPSPSALPPADSRRSSSVAPVCSSPSSLLRSRLARFNDTRSARRCSCCSSLSLRVRSLLWCAARRSATPLSDRACSPSGKPVCQKF